MTTFNGEMARTVITSGRKRVRATGAARYDKGHLAVRLAKGVASANDGECWFWMQNKIPRGYGLVGFGSHNMYAHRLAFELHYGINPEGKLVCHTCDNPSCVNPAHLFLGTQVDNIRDCVRKGRHFSPDVRFFGERNPMSKLKASDVLEIRARYASGNATHKSLSEEYGVSPSMVTNIVTRKAWKHLPEHSS